MDDHPEQQHRILAETSPVTSAILSNLFLFGLIFGLSATIEVRNMRQQITNKFAIGTGLTVQFVCLPLLGFLAVKIFENGLTQAMALALLVVTSSPGGSYSNWWCSTFNADLPLSVAMTTVSSIASIAFLPFNLFLYSFLAFGGSDVLQHLDFPKLFISLAIVLTAIGSGLLAGYYYDTKIFHVWANRLGSICGIALIVFSIIFSSGGGGSSTNFWEYSASFYLAVAFPCLFGLLLANIIAKCAKLSGPEVVAIAIECCVQNTGIATSVAITMFDDPEERAQAVAVPLLYGIYTAGAIAVFCLYSWKAGNTKAPKDENLCVVISTTYEVSGGEEEESAAAGEEGNDTDENNIDIEQPGAEDNPNAPLSPQQQRSWWSRIFGVSKSKHDDAIKVPPKKLETVEKRNRTHTADTLLSSSPSTVRASSLDVDLAIPEGDSGEYNNGTVGENHGGSDSESANKCD